MTQFAYWEECLAQSMEEYGVKATSVQISSIARDIEIAHENYGMAFYTPPPSDRINQEIRDLTERHKRELAAAEKRERALTEVVARRHNLNPDKIGSDDQGRVLYYDGRITEIYS